jgi:amidase
MPDLLDSASNLHAALLRREFSARDLLGSTLAAIERLNPAVNAIVQKDAGPAWRAASDADARIARGEARPLEGLPATIKDCFEVAGMVTSAGAPALQNYIPKEDASAVARLRRAGAILLGKTIPFSPTTSRPTTAFTGRPITHGTPAFPPVGPRAEPRRPSPLA